MEELALNHKRTVEMLTKLLRAARRAHDEGKDRALEKIIDQANRLSSHLNENMHKMEPVNAGDFYQSYMAAQNEPQFVRVEGVVVE